MFHWLWPSDEPADTMTLDDWRRHLDATVVIEVHEPKLHLTQGSFLRVSRRNVSSTIQMIIDATPGRVRLTVKDSVTAAELRRQALEAKNR